MDLLEEGLVEAHQEVASEVTGVDDVGEGPLSSICSSAITFASKL